MLTAVEWNESHILIVGDVGRGEKLADEGDAGVGGGFGSKKDCFMLAPDCFAMQLPGRAEDASEGEAAKGVSSVVVSRDERSVKPMHQYVIPEGQGVMQVCRGGGESGGGPGEAEGLGPIVIIGLEQVADL